MRYYSIQITNPASGKGIREYTSFFNGATDPGALNVELDIPVTAFATPSGAAGIRVWGVSLHDISQASDLNGMAVQVFAGMQKGLPLANPYQAGLLASGIIQQAFGNWIGTDMSLDIVFYADGGTEKSPKNIVLNWSKGTPFSSAIDSTLQAAFPNIKRNIAINPNLVLPADEPGFYGTLTQFATYVLGVSRSIIGGDYPGVSILLKDDTFTIFDESTKKKPINIAFNDLIGQPTWIGPLQMQFNTVMRYDLTVGDFVTLPVSSQNPTGQAPGQVTTTADALSFGLKNKSIFQGTFVLDYIRHVGNFRNPDGQSWITTANAHPSGPS